MDDFYLENMSNWGKKKKLDSEQLGKGLFFSIEHFGI